MAIDRDENQKKWGCLSISLLAHGAIGATIALAPLANAKKERPSAVYLEEAKMPKGKQLETLPAAEQIAQQEEEKPVEPTQEAPPAQEEVKAKEVVASKPAKKVATTLPQKKTTVQAKADEPAKAQEPDISVKSALAAARAEESNAEAHEQGEELLSPPAIAEQQEAEGLKAETQEEDTASGMTAPAQEEEKAEPIKKDTPIAAAVDTAQTTTETKTETAAPKTETQKSATAQTTTTGTGNGAQTAPVAPYGIRDAETLSQAAGNKNPVYPDRDRLARNQGTAVFVARVLPNGTVVEIKLEKSTNSKTLDASAMEAMKNWRFLPGQEGMIRKAFNFSLNGNAQEMPARLRR